MDMVLEMIGNLKKKYNLPSFEDLSPHSLKANEIMDKIRDFYARWEKSGYDDLAPLYFVELLKFYPVSICKRDMSDTLKTLITLAYFDSKPSPRDKEPIWEGFSYDDLSLIFCRSKASIHDAIIENEAQVKNIIKSAKNHVCPVCGKRQANEQTNEQPPRGRERV